MSNFADHVLQLAKDEGKETAIHVIEQTCMVLETILECGNAGERADAERLLVSARHAMLAVEEYSNPMLWWLHP